MGCLTVKFSANNEESHLSKITSSDHCVMVKVCSSVTMLTYCFLGLWLTHDTQIATVVFRVLYLVSICIRSLSFRWGLAVQCVRTYAMTLDTIYSSFGYIFQIVILFFLVYGTLLQHLRILDTSPY